MMALKVFENYSYEDVYNYIDLLNQLDIPKNLSEIVVEASSVERLAEKALKDSAFATNPRTASLEEMVDLINISMNKGR